MSIRKSLSPSAAASFLAICHIPKGANFHALDTDQVQGLIEQADLVKYRRPKNANGSRARYFHAYLVRRANSLTGQADEAVKGRNCTVMLKLNGRSVTRSTP